VRIALVWCTLREWRVGDEPSLAHYANNRNVARALRDQFPQPYTMADAADWIQRNLAAVPQTQFAIEVGGAAVGGIGLILQPDVFRTSSEIGYWLGEEFWGRGIMTEAVKAVTAYGFASFDLTHIYAGVFESNPASARVLEKAGFALEGRLRQHVAKDGVAMDLLFYGIVRPSALQGRPPRTENLASS
jgi:RimJ/RimL family protein N-acetyltransferase